jgi:hypothetical protein
VAWLSRRVASLGLDTPHQENTMVISPRKTGNHDTDKAPEAITKEGMGGRITARRKETLEERLERAWRLVLAARLHGGDGAASKTGSGA